MDNNDIEDHGEEIYFDDNDEPVESDNDQQEMGEDEELELEDEEINDMSTLTFHLHSQPVFACDISPNGRLAITGSQDDTAYVWSMRSGKVKFKCSGHADSITCVAFNCSGSYVATGDMHGLLQVWDVATGESIMRYELGDLNWLKWHKEHALVLLAGSEEGGCWLFKVNDMTKMKVMMGPSSCTVGSFLRDGRRVVTGYEDGSIRVWDLTTTNTLFTIKSYDRIQSLCCIAARSDDLVAIGGVDAKVRLLNANTGKITWEIDCSEGQKDEEEIQNSVEGVAFSESLPLLATACVNGVIELWDINSKVKRFSIKSDGGVSKIMLGTLNVFTLYVSGLDGVLRMYDIRDGNLMQEITGHQAEMLDFAITAEEDAILTVSEDHTAKTYFIQ